MHDVLDGLSRDGSLRGTTEAGDSSAGADACLPAELKGRLDVLVQQVQAALDDNAAAPQPEDGSYESFPKVSSLQSPGSGGSLTLPRVRSGDRLSSTSSSTIFQQQRFPSTCASSPTQSGLKISGSGGCSASPALAAIPDGPRTPLRAHGSVHPGHAKGPSPANLGPTRAPSTVGTVQLPPPAQAETTSLSPPAAPGQPIVAKQSGPPVVLATRVSEMQRLSLSPQPLSPQHGATPCPQREGAASSRPGTVYRGAGQAAGGEEKPSARPVAANASAAAMVPALREPQPSPKSPKGSIFQQSQATPRPWPGSVRR